MGVVKLKTIQIRIDEKIHRQLQELASIEGRTESELIREAIAKLLRERGLIGGDLHESDKHRNTIEKGTA